MKPDVIPLDRPFLLRAGVTLVVLIAVEVARVLYLMGGGPVGDGVALYVAVLLGGLFTVPAREGVLGDLPGVVAFLLAPLAVVGAVGVLALPFVAGGLDLRVGAAVLGLGAVGALAVLVAAELVPAEGWGLPADRNALATVAGEAGRLLRTVFRPGGVTAAGFVLGSLLRG